MVSKFSGTLLNMVSDFANINRSPDTNAKSNRKPQNPAINAMKKIERRHSLNLAVGVSDETPPFTPLVEAKFSGGSTQSKIERARAKGRRQSAPAISDSAHEDFHEKLRELKETSSLKEAISEESEKDEMIRTPKQSALPDYPSSNKEESKEQAEQSDVSEQRPESTLKLEEISPVQQAKIVYRREQRASVVFIDDDVTRPLCGVNAKS